MKARQRLGLPNLLLQAEVRWQSCVYTMDKPEWRLPMARHTSLGLVPVSLTSDLSAKPPDTLTGLNLLPWTD